MTDIRYTELHGKGVLSQDGRELGEVDARLSVRLAALKRALG